MIIDVTKNDPKSKITVNGIAQGESTLDLSTLLTQINSAIAARLLASNHLVNPGTRQLFGPTQGRVMNMQVQSVPKALKEVAFYFKGSNDPADLRPLQGVIGTPDGGNAVAVGTTSTSNSSGNKFQRASFTFLSKAVAWCAVYTGKDEKEKARYGTRVLALAIDGQNKIGDVSTVIVPAKTGKFTPSDPQLQAGTIPWLNSAMAKFNEQRSNYVVIQKELPINLSVGPDDEANSLKLMNAKVGLHKGNSSVYIDELDLMFAGSEKQFALDTATVTKLSFILDFVKTTQGAPQEGTDFGTYETDFKANRNNRSVDIIQSGSSFTLSIPAVSHGVYQGVTNTMSTSPFTYQRTSSKSSQTETSDATEALEKLTLKLPAVSYQLRNFTATRPEDVTAIIRAEIDPSGKKPATTLTIPLGRKIIFSKDADGVVNAIVDCI